MWLRDLPAATIHIIKRSYTLAPTEQKRQIIRTSYGEYIATRPFLMKDGKKTTMGPSTLFFLPQSSIKALPDSTIRALPRPLSDTIYLSPPLPYILHMPAPKILYPITPIIPIMPDLTTLDIETFELIVIPTSQQTIYPTNSILTTTLGDDIEMSLPFRPILIDHFNYIPSLPIPKRKRPVKKLVTDGIVSGKKLSKVIRSKKKSASHNSS